jgi:hypothetical protein
MSGLPDANYFTEMGDARPFDEQDRALELHRPRPEVGQQRRAGTEDHRDQVDPDLVQQPGLEGLAGPSAHR